MSNKTFETVVADLSSSLMDFNRGDLVRLSDIIDLLDELKGLSPCPSITGPLFDAVHVWLGDELSGVNVSDAPLILTDFIDLVSCIDEQVSAGCMDAGVLPDWLAQEASSMAGRIPKPSGHRVAESAASPQDAARAQLVASNREEPSMAPDVNDIFFHEATERLVRAQSIIIDMESSSDPGLTNELFRVFHTIKGEAGFLGFPVLGHLSHQMENLLDRMRQGILKYDSSAADLLLGGTDLAQKLLGEAASTGRNSEQSSAACNALVQQLTSYLGKQVAPLGNLIVDSGMLGHEDLARALEIQRECGWLKKLGEILVEEAMLSPREVESILNRQRDIMSRAAGCADPVADGVAQEVVVEGAAPVPGTTAAAFVPAEQGAPGSVPPVLESPGQPVAASRKAGMEEIVNVKAGQIRFLIDMVGELLINLQQLDESDRNVMSARKIARNLQHAAMQLGTVRIGTLFGNMKRISRDAARQTGKEFDLIFEGESIEVDRNLVERLGEPLMHLLRNAISHGLESSATERSAAGKPARGCITLKAERRGQHVMVSVVDDGAGIKSERILKKALEKGLLTPEEAQHLKPEQIRDFIFRPGFSTAEQVDGLSGRGVGMDVVRSMVESMRGTIQLHTEEGQMTRVSLAFPINMAIIEGMIIRLAHRYFVLPVGNIVEAMELQDSLFHELRDGVRVLTLRGETMPVLDLARWFGLDPAPEGSRNLGIIVESRERRYAFMVHEIISKREVVIKPLGTLLAGLKGISSGTILQGGKIGLVVDVDEVVRTS